MAQANTAGDKVATRIKERAKLKGPNVEAMLKRYVLERASIVSSRPTGPR